MDDLAVALRQLAGQAVSPSAGDPSALWRTGRARARRRRATALVAAVGLAVAGYAALVRPEPTVVMPAGQVHAPAIPENIYSPTRFLAGVSDEGPPGRLAVIAEKPGDEEGDGQWFGISAITGEYRYLDLPHEAGTSAMALSADGSRIAYWVTGPTRKSSFGKPTGTSDGGPLPDKPTTGVAVYDTSTGRIDEHQVLTDFGIQPAEGPQGGLAWLADDTLVFTYAIRTGTNTTRFASSYRWSPVGHNVPVVLGEDLESEPSFAPVLPGNGWITTGKWITTGVVEDDEAMGSVFVDSEGRPTDRAALTIRSMGSNGDGRVTVSGGRIVGIGVSLIDETLSDATTTTSLGAPRVTVGEVPDGGGKVALSGVGSVVDPWFVGWLSPTSVLVVARPGERPNPEYFEPGNFPGEGALYAKDGPDGAQDWLYDVDVVTGRTRRVGVVAPELSSVQVATDLLGKPMVHGDEPPGVISSLRVPVAVGVAVLTGLACFWYFRPRRRAWRAYLARERGDDA